MAYIAPFIWCANKIIMDPLFLYFNVTKNDKKCFAREELAVPLFIYFSGPMGMVIDVVSLCSLSMKMGLLKKKLEKIIWFILILADLLSYISLYIQLRQHSWPVLLFGGPILGHSNLYLGGVYLLRYFNTVSLTYTMFIRATRTSATLAKATWAKAAFNLLLYLLGGHVFGGLWYAFAIEKKIDCWMIATNNHAFSLGYPYTFSCHIFGKFLLEYDISDEMCSPKTQDSAIYDFGIYYDALKSGIIEVPNLLQRISYSLRWGLQNLSGFGQDLQVSTDTWENIFVISFTIYGLVLFVFFIGNMQVYLQLETKRSEKIILKEMEKSKSFAKLSKNLQKQIKRYQPDKWEEIKNLQLENLFDDVPDDIKKNIKRTLCLEIVKQVEEFRNWNDAILDELCDRAKPVFYTQYAQIVRKGSPIDEMLFLVHGKLQTYSLTNVNTGPVSTIVSAQEQPPASACTQEQAPPEPISTSQWRISIDHLEDGMFCGEELIDWFRADPYSSKLPNSTRTIQTLTKVDAFALMSYDLQNLFIKHWAASACASTQEQTLANASIQEQAPVSSSSHEQAPTSASTQEQAPPA